MPEDIKNPGIDDKNEKFKDFAADIEQIKDVSEIVRLLGKTASQMKLYASDHVSLSKFTDELFNKLDEFLKKHGKLELGVQKSSFTYGKKTVYSEKQLKESLPFLFYKDGVHSLLFYKDLTLDEFLDFLEIIKKEVNLCPEESDVVLSLWAKDFANIRYFVSNEFLGSKIGIGMKPKEYTYDSDSLIKGKIELDDEDKKALEDAILSEELASEKDDQIGGNFEITEEGMTPLSYALDKAEIEKLEDMLEKNRSITAEEELVALIMEMLYLEKRPEPFRDVVDALNQCHDQLLEKENYSLAVHLIHSVIEFIDILSSQKDSRYSSLRTFLDSVTSSETLSDLKKYITEDQILAPESLLDYLNILGPKSIPVLSHLYEHDKRPDYRKKVLKVLKKLGSADLQGLMNVVQNEKPDLAKAIISVLSEVNGKRSIQHLATFINYSNRDIKAEAIKALGKYIDMTANRLLLTFLKDDDVKLRVQAAQSCQHICDKNLRDHIFNTVKSKTFKKKSEEEILAFLELLGRTQTDQAYQTLRSFLKKARIIASGKMKEMSLSTVSALESLGTSEARVILEEGTRMHNRSIKQACQKSLRNLTQRH